MVDAHREPPKLVVYDLDGVITRKDTFTALIVRQLVRSPLRLFRSLPLMSAMIGKRKAEASRKIAEIALAGMTDAGYDALVEQLGREFANEAKWMRPETVERIQCQYDSGVRVVIATATERRLAEALLAAAKIPYDLLSASLLEVTSSGLKVGDHRVGARKTEALLELDVAIASAEFVTDSVTDLPTAKVAASVVLIGASEGTRRRFGQAAVAFVSDG